MRHLGRSGQAMVESLMGVLVALFLIGVLVFTGLLFLSTMYLDHLVYRSAVCLAEGNSAWNCRQQFLKNASLVQGILTPQNLVLSKTGRRNFVYTASSVIRPTIFLIDFSGKSRTPFLLEHSVSENVLKKASL